MSSNLTIIESGQQLKAWGKLYTVVEEAVLENDMGKILVVDTDGEALTILADDVSEWL